MGAIRDETPGEQHMRAVILIACILAHLALGIWLAQAWRDTHHDDIALEISFIPAVSEPAPALPVPPFPVAPSRPAPIQAMPRRQATPSLPPDPPAQPADAALPEVLQPRPSTARLLEAAEAAARANFDSAMPAPRDPTRRYAPALAGRAEPYTPNAIVLRKQFAPEDVVKMIGRLFGGNYDPCPDTRSRIHDITTRNERIDEDELRLLIDRERRRCRPG